MLMKVQLDQGWMKEHSLKESDDFETIVVL